MSKPAHLADIVNALEIQFEEYASYLNRDTGIVETVAIELLEAAGESLDEVPDVMVDWEEEEWELAKQIATSDRFERLPTQFDIHEWAIMEEFARTVKSAEVRAELDHALHGAGAFRHFKATVRRHDIEEDWFAYRAEALRRIALAWCAEHDIEWV
jgi:hypothetical protein